MANSIPLKYDLNQFSYTLAKAQGFWCKKTYYYDAPPYQSPLPSTDEKLRRSRYDRFIKFAKRLPNFVVREGRTQKLSENTYCQKGVDTLITMDLQEEPFKEKVSNA